MPNLPEENDNVEKLGFKRLITIAIWTFKLFFRISPIRTTVLLTFSILKELRNIFYTYIFAKILDEIIKNIQNGTSDIKSLYPYFVVIVIYMLLFEALIPSIYSYARRTLNQIFRRSIDRIMYQKLNTLGVQTLEDPETINLIKRVNNWTTVPLEVLSESVIFISNFVVVIVAAAIIFQFLPIFIPILAVYTILTFIPENYFMKKDFRWQVNNTEGMRKMRQSSFILTEPSELQEVNINNSFKFFDDKYSEFVEWYLEGFIKIIRSSQIVRFMMDFLGKFITIYGYIIIVSQALLGTISIGSVLFYIRSLDYFASSLSGLLSSATYINEFAIKTDDILKVFEMEPLYKDGNKKIDKLENAPEIEFKDVSFKYPGSKKYVYKDLNLKIRSGEKVAIVGHNGAGKTTLVKLIAKIYPTTKGSILINGIDIKKIKTSEWYKNLGILFQEFNFYGYLTVKENIYLGNPSDPMDEKKIVEAAINADADDFIMEYAKGYDQILSEKYKDGVRPSTGQQQKIAIAKFFYRNAPVAIFDEPTAAIDAVSEYKIFNKIYSFFKSKTVIIISHRFSTVRNADRIIVIEKGKIIEEGSHSELMKKAGAYALAFRLQAEGYSEKDN